MGGYPRSISKRWGEYPPPDFFIVGGGGVPSPDSWMSKEPVFSNQESNDLQFFRRSIILNIQNKNEKVAAFPITGGGRGPPPTPHARQGGHPLTEFFA
ncbi:MAG: hypothetical protein CVV32_10510 [Methanomicrobiales archaeon HGW-Methanomicrobiales-3]|nr:MAG: hypothetical protein CVV32_10510 [Methanomicrobiales archaeon HGW-Methanomicrobiales-3]